MLRSIFQTTIVRRAEESETKGVLGKKIEEEDIPEVDRQDRGYIPVLKHLQNIDDTEVDEDGETRAGRQC